MFSLNNIFLIPYFLFSLCFVNENASLFDTIDLKNKESKAAFYKIELYKSMALANEALQLSKKSAYSKGKTVSSLYLAKVFIELGDYNTALDYINGVKEEPFFCESIIMQVESYRLQGRIYGLLNMNVKAEEEFKNQLFYSSEIEDIDKQKLSRFWAYQNLNAIYIKTDQTDSLTKYLDFQLKMLSEIEVSEHFYGFSDTYCLIADNLLRQGNPKEAKTYIDKAYHISQQYDSKYLFKVFELYGDYEKAVHNIDGCLEYYDLALHNSLELKYMNAAKGYYKKISDVLLTKDNDVDRAKAKSYLLRYNQINDSLKMVNSDILDKIYLHILHEQQLSTDSKKKSYQFSLIGFGGVSILVLLYFYYKKNRYKQILKVKTVETIHQHNTIDQLEDQLHDTRFKDMMELAKSNSPDFIILFEELYPDVIKKIKELNPGANISEMSFLALSHLNFSTKELSQIFNVTVRAIQVRKNRLRKKYKIASDVDFNYWYNALVGSD